MKIMGRGRMVGVFAVCTVGVVAVAGWVLLGRGGGERVLEKRARVESSQKRVMVTMGIDYDMGMPVEQKKIPATKGESVLSVLKRTNKVVIKQYSFGELVDSINGIQGGEDGKYWIYMVNGKEATVGAGKFLIESDSVIIWKLKAYEK